MGNYQIDRQRWWKLSIYEQMANIGSEVGRSIKAYRRGDEERFNKALDRALDLFSATAEGLVHKSPCRLREVLRARDEYLKLFFEGTFDSDAENIERYFNYFAFLARKLQLQERSAASGREATVNN